MNELEGLERFDPDISGEYHIGNGYAIMEEVPDGEWIRYDEIDAVLNRRENNDEHF